MFAWSPNLFIFRQNFRSNTVPWQQQPGLLVIGSPSQVSVFEVGLIGIVQQVTFTQVCDNLVPGLGKGHLVARVQGKLWQQQVTHRQGGMGAVDAWIAST